ncbi:MAG: SdrD B-like domain-containing protein, partial [Tepidisphaeraceae bacterium]
PGLAGATIELYAASGAMASSATTDSAGQFGFQVPVGESAYLRFITPAGLIPTRQNQGIDEERDSDADRVTGLVPPFMLTEPGDVDRSIDGGFLAPSSIAGVMFSDRNGNGVRDAGEPGVPGFVIFIDQNDDGTRQNDEPVAISADDGTYAFENLLPDSYRLLVEDQHLWVEPGALDIVLAPETAVSDADRPLRTTVPDSAAVAVGPQLRVNAPTTSWAREPAVAVDADGDFVVAWVHFFYSPSSIRAQRFNAAGVPQGEEFIVTSTGIGVSFGPTAAPSVAMDADGDFVIVWPSYFTDGSNLGIRARRYDSQGVPQGGEFQVNTYTTGDQWDSSVAMSEEGDFVVAWTSNAQDGSGYGVYAQRYVAAGIPQGSEFRVNVHTTGDQSQPSVSMDADGDFVIVWEGDGPGYDDQIWARRLRANGE